MPYFPPFLCDILYRIHIIIGFVLFVSKKGAVTLFGKHMEHISEKGVLKFNSIFEYETLILQKAGALV